MHLYYEAGAPSVYHGRAPDMYGLCKMPETRGVTGTDQGIPRVDTGVSERTAQTPRTQPPPVSDWTRIIVAGLLLVVVIAGIRAGFGLTWSSAWQGPWHDRGHGIVLAVALEAVCAGLLIAIAVLHRRSRDPGSPARQLRRALTRLIAAVMVAIGAALAFVIHLSIHPRPLKTPLRRFSPAKLKTTRAPVPAGTAGGLDYLKYVVLAIVAIALAAMFVILLRRIRSRAVPVELLPVLDDEAALRDAVEAGRMALGEVSEPRMAIIKCYLAMERSLAEAGAVRIAAETPDELLARSLTAGLLHGDAPAELTSLFYEARFSTHPVPESARRRALAALDLIVADLDGRAGAEGSATAGSAAAP
jgi:hypothetical protein